MHQHPRLAEKLFKQPGLCIVILYDRYLETRVVHTLTDHPAHQLKPAGISLRRDAKALRPASLHIVSQHFVHYGAFRRLRTVVPKLRSHVAQ